MQRGLPIRHQAENNRPLIFDLRPPKRQTEEIREDFKFKFKASVLLVILFYLFVGGIFAFVIGKTLRATGEENIATVDFYVNTVRTLNVEDMGEPASAEATAGEGWSDIDKVLGQPEVSESGDEDSFSAANSALYNGGRQSLICENFTTKEFIKTPTQEVVPETDVPETVMSEESPEESDISESVSPTQIEQPTGEGDSGDAVDLPEEQEESDSENSADDELSGGAEVEANANQTSLEVGNQESENSSNSAEEVLSISNEDESGVQENNSSDNSAAAESGAETDSLSEPVAQNHLPAASDIAPAVSEFPSEIPSSEPTSSPADSSSASESSGPVSFLNNLKKIISLSGAWLGGQAARAQSLFGSDSDDRNILFGAFKSAKIKISLATFYQAETSEPVLVPAEEPLSEPMPEENVSEPVTEESPSESEAETPSEPTPALAENPIAADNADDTDNQENPEIIPSAETAAPAEPESENNYQSSESEGGDGGIIQNILEFLAPTEAGAEELDDATLVDAEKIKIIIWYSFSDEGDGNYWRELGTIEADNLSNFSRDGYLIFDAPFLNDWRDLDDLRLKFEGQTKTGDSFSAYLDSVWVEIIYQTASLQSNETRPKKNTDKNILEVDGKTIEFGYTDDNGNENLIIKTNKEKYYGLTEATVYFSVENIGVREEQINFQYYFPAGVGAVKKMERLFADSPYLMQVPKFDAQIYECANGWDRRGDNWSCYPTGEEKNCDLVSPNRRYCRLEGVQVGTEEKIRYRQRWEEVNLQNDPLKSKKNFFQSLFGLGPQSKEVPSDFQNAGATAESETIAPGEVKYFKTEINFPFNSEGEFYIEAIGAADGYGLLDPWWNSGWNYRIPITLDNSGNASALTEYQIYLEISSSTNYDFWSNVKSDGGDIRFANSAEDTELPYWIQDYDYTASSAKIWVQVDSISAATTSRIFLYYGNGSANTTSDQYEPFTYDSLQNIFYIASSSAAENIKVVSLIDGNQVQLDSQTAVNLDRQDVTTLTGFTSTSVVKAKGPIMAKLSNKSAAESTIPISFAGTSFAVPSGRNLENFHFYAPFANATTTIYDGVSSEQSQQVDQNNSWSIANDIATGSIAVITATAPVLFSFADGAPGDSLVPYPATTRDLYGIKSQYNLIGAVANSSFAIYCSSGSSTLISSLPAGYLQPNQICSGEAEGQGNAVRLAGATGAIGAIQQNDSDGNESTVFLPFKEFSSEYMLPTNAAHIAIVCAPETESFEINLYDSGDVFVASTSCSATGEYPGKAYFGAADAATYSAGSRIISASGEVFYAYYEDTSASGAGGGDETNLFGAVQTRKYSYPDPAYAFGEQEIKGPPTGSINSVAEKNDNSGRVNISIAVNDLSRDNCRAKIEYVASSSGGCDFGSPLNPTLDENAENISATYGAPVIQSKNAYQVGTSTGWIITASGSNTIIFDWLSKTDLPDADGEYCLRLTANDNISDQATSATTTIVLDNVAPSVPGSLSVYAKTGASVTFNLGATSTDTHFSEYRIYYKVYDGTVATEADTMFSSSSDTNLGNAEFNGATTTTVTGLTAGLKYTFNIFSYDTYGNKASSTAGLDATANDAPTATFNSASEKTDGTGIVDVSIEVDDANDDNTVRVRLEYEAGSICDFASPSTSTIDTNNVAADFGTVQIDNNDSYQVGTTSYYILTSPGSNTVSFDWLSGTDLPSATGTYCLRLTANDGTDDQITPDKIVVVIDNVKPVAPGDLSKGSTTMETIQLFLPVNQIARDDNEPDANAYKIFYKIGTSGAKQTDTEFDSSVLDVYSFNSSSSVIVGGLDADTDYVFNIFAYDTFGNVATATEITAKTDAALTNKSLTFTNANILGTSTNLAIADGLSVWNFRAVVSDIDGYTAITDVTLRLADEVDNSSPFDDLSFKWTRSGNVFEEIGTDANSAASLSGSSASSCADNTCTVDFQIVFVKTFATSSVDYSSELYSTDGSARSDEDSYVDFLQIRKTWLDQNHYRWRNDDGGG